MVAVGGVALGRKTPRITDFCNCVMGFQPLAMRLATDEILCLLSSFPYVPYLLLNGVEAYLDL